MNPMMLNTQRDKNCSVPTAEQKVLYNITLTGLFSRDIIEREEWIQCHFVDYECEKGHEFVESLPLSCEISRAIHVNIELLGHAKKEEIHRQAENLRQSLREYFFSMQSLPHPKEQGTLTRFPTGVIYQSPLLLGQDSPCINRW